MDRQHDPLAMCVTWSLWLIAQVGMLAVLGAQVPLAAKFPAPIENASAIAIVCTQLILAAAMGRQLLPNTSALLAAIAAATPMILLATLLSGQPATAALLPLLLVSLWLGAFASLAQIRDPMLRTVSQTLQVLASTGLPLLLYLCWEFGIRPVRHDGWLALLSPTLGAASLCLPGSPKWWVFAAPTLVSVGFLIKVGVASPSRSTPLTK